MLNISRWLLIGYKVVIYYICNWLQRVVINTYTLRYRYSINNHTSLSPSVAGINNHLNCINGDGFRSVKNTDKESRTKGIKPQNPRSLCLSRLSMRETRQLVERGLVSCRQSVCNAAQESGRGVPVNFLGSPREVFEMSIGVRRSRRSQQSISS